MKFAVFLILSTIARKNYLKIDITVEVEWLLDGMCEKNCENSSAKISFWSLHEKKNHTGANGKTQPLSLCRFSFIFNLACFFLTFIYISGMYTGAILYLNKKKKKHEDLWLLIGEFSKLYFCATIACPSHQRFRNVGGILGKAS